MSAAVSDRGVVAAPHFLAAEAGRAILAEGGNAYEAMIAMAASIAVVYPHMNAIGGDGFWLVREPSGEVRYIEACCRAGSRATPAFYRDRGYDSIPARGPLSALVVPGAINGWRMALELSSRAGGRLPLDMLLADAIGHARAGFAVSPCQGRTVPKLFEEIVTAPGFADTFMREGKMLAAGDHFVQARLADTLEHLVRAGLADFYQGDIARELASDLDRIGAPVSRDDFASHQARLLPPLRMTIRGGVLHNAPPPTQGLASLIILGVMERLGVTDDQGPDYLHTLVEATKRAFAIRDRACADYDRMDRDPQSWLSPERLDREAGAVDRARAAAFPAPHLDEGDTVWLGAIDGEGRAISYIQSIFWEFGSGCVSPATGVLFQNRGAAFSLDPADANPLAPGRQPFHTLNPPIAVMDDGRIITYGTMGGEGQPQTQAMTLSRYLWLGQSVEQAVTAPRVRLGRSWGEDDASLKYETRFDPATLDRLASMGHELSSFGADFTDEAGHAGIIVRDARGRIEGAHDPRSDGGALGV